MMTILNVLIIIHKKKKQRHIITTIICINRRVIDRFYLSVAESHGNKISKN